MLGAVIALQIRKDIGFPAEIVMQAVAVHDGDGGQFLGRCVIERGELHDVALARPPRRGAPAERADAAGCAELVMDVLLAELVIGEIALARKQPEFPFPHRRQPVPPLGADRAVALETALRKIEIGLVGDGFAVTAAVIGFFHARAPEIYQNYVLNLVECSDKTPFLSL